MPPDAASGCCCARRAISPAQPPRPQASWCMAGCGTSSMAISGWCASRWPNARCCYRWRHIWYGRCLSSCRRGRDRGLAGCYPLGYLGDLPYVLRSDDGRKMYFVPMVGSCARIGAYDLPFAGAAAAALVTEAEVAYRGGGVVCWFGDPQTSSDVVWRSNVVVAL